MMVFRSVGLFTLDLMDHLAQLIGYVMVVKPEIAFLISSSGLSKQLNMLLINYKRLDLLKYKDRNNRDRKIIIGHWDVERKDLLPVVQSELPWLNEISILILIILSEKIGITMS